MTGASRPHPRAPPAFPIPWSKEYGKRREGHELRTSPFSKGVGAEEEVQGVARVPIAVLAVEMAGAAGLLISPPSQ